MPNVHRLPFSCAIFLSGGHSFCSSDCAGADTHIIDEEEGEGGILPSANAAGGVADFFAEAMGLEQGESIDEELNVTNATNEWVSGSFSVTAVGGRPVQRLRGGGDVTNLSPF